MATAGTRSANSPRESATAFIFFALELFPEAGTERLPFRRGPGPQGPGRRHETAKSELSIGICLLKRLSLRHDLSSVWLPATLWAGCRYPYLPGATGMLSLSRRRPVGTAVRTVYGGGVTD